MAIIRSITNDVSESEFIQALAARYKKMNERKIEEYNKKLKEQAKQNKKPLAETKNLPLPQEKAPLLLTTALKN